MTDTQGARFLFDITFAVVLVSLVVQGSSLGWMARRLKLELPREPGPVTRFDFEGLRADAPVLLAFRIQPASHLAATLGDALFRFDKLRCIAVTRRHRLLFPKPQFVFAAHDLVYLITPARSEEELAVLFRGDDKTPNAPQARSFFGTFTIRGDAAMDGLIHVYGISRDPALADLTVADAVRARLRRRPVEGDIVDIGRMRLIVRSLHAGVIESVGLQLLAAEGPRKRGPERRG